MPLGTRWTRARTSLSPTRAQSHRPGGMCEAYSGSGGDREVEKEVWPCEEDGGEGWCMIRWRAELRRREGSTLSSSWVRSDSEINSRQFQTRPHPHHCCSPRRSEPRILLRRSWGTSSSRWTRSPCAAHATARFHWPARESWTPLQGFERDSSRAPRIGSLGMGDRSARAWDGAIEADAVVGEGAGSAWGLTAAWTRTPTPTQGLNIIKGTRSADATADRPRRS